MIEDDSAQHAGIAIKALERTLTDIERELRELREAVTNYFHYADVNTPVGKTRAEYESTSSMVVYARDRLRVIAGIEPRKPFYDDAFSDD